MYTDHDLKVHKQKIHRRTIVVIILVVLVIFNTIGLLLGSVFYTEFCELDTRANLSRFNTLQKEYERGKRLKGWEDVTVQSKFGYPLSGTFLPNPKPSANTVVFLHGFMANRMMGLWYADTYLNQGYNVLIYDARDHGDSGGSSVTWGYYEKYDLDRWIDWLTDRYPNGIIGVHGASMGAATALEHAGLNEENHRVKFYVADSAYADLEELLYQQIYHSVPTAHPLWISALLKYSSAFAYLKSGFVYSQVSPVHTVRQVSTPILFLQGDADTLVPAGMGPELFASATGYKEIQTFPGTGHVMAIFDHKSEYNQAIRDFIPRALSQQHR